MGLPAKVYFKMSFVVLNWTKCQINANIKFLFPSKMKCWWFLWPTSKFFGERQNEYLIMKICHYIFFHDGMVFPETVALQSLTDHSFYWVYFKRVKNIKNYFFKYLGFLGLETPAISQNRSQTLEYRSSKEAKGLERTRTTS